VNVHPTKLEVRFQDGGRLYSQLLGMLRMKFLTVDLKARASAGGIGHDGPVDSSAASTAEPAELVAWAKEQLLARGVEASETTQSPQQWRERATENGHSTSHRDQPPPSGEPLRLFRFDRPAGGVPCGGEPEAGSALRRPAEAPTTIEHAATRRPDQPQVPRALQVHNRYLIAETDDGVEVIDQHALHERILYEQLRERVLSGPLESQRLLVPEPVDLAASEATAVLEQRELLAELGVEVEPFGGDTVLIASYPAMLANMQPADVLRELVEHLLAGGKRPERRDLLDRLLHSIACKAAVKYGDYLTPEEVASLLAQRHLAQDHHHCPHGRPTALVFTREDLDRQFKRV
jgi:DNA mismatch repair protein MutL